MVKHTPQTTRRQQLTNCLCVFDHFVGLTLKGLNFDYDFWCFQGIINGKINKKRINVEFIFDKLVATKKGVAVSKKNSTIIYSTIQPHAILP